MHWPQQWHLWCPVVQIYMGRVDGNGRTDQRDKGVDIKFDQF